MKPVWRGVIWTLFAAIVSAVAILVESWLAPIPVAKVEPLSIVVLVDLAENQKDWTALPSRFATAASRKGYVVWTAGFNSDVSPVDLNTLPTVKVSPEQPGGLERGLEAAQTALGATNGPKLMTIWLNRRQITTEERRLAGRLTREGWLVAVYGSQEAYPANLRLLASGDELAFRENELGPDRVLRRALADLDRSAARLEGAFQGYRPPRKGAIQLALTTLLLTLGIGAFQVRRVGLRLNPVWVGTEVLISFVIGFLTLIFNFETMLPFVGLMVALSVTYRQRNPHWTALFVLGGIGLPMLGYLHSLRGDLLFVPAIAVFVAALALVDWWPGRNYVQLSWRGQTEAFRLGRDDIRVGSAEPSDWAVEGMPDRLGIIRVRGQVAEMLVEGRKDVVPLYANHQQWVDALNIRLVGDYLAPRGVAVVEVEEAARRIGLH
jgi:hypothetical protein